MGKLGRLPRAIRTSSVFLSSVANLLLFYAKLTRFRLCLALCSFRIPPCLIEFLEALTEISAFARRSVLPLDLDLDLASALRGRLRVLPSLSTFFQGLNFSLRSIFSPSLVIFMFFFIFSSSRSLKVISGYFLTLMQFFRSLFAYASSVPTAS
jgi:hypothetical protein